MDAAAEAALAHGLYAVPLFIGASLTLIACGVIIVTYRTFEELRRHPNGFVWFRSFLDIVFAVTVIVESAMRTGGVGDRVDCRAFSFLLQFSLVGSELCLFALSMDLFNALRNPFVNYKSNMRNYRVGIFLGSAALAGLLIGVGGPGVYGMTDFGICWILPQRASVANGYMWAFFYVFLLATYAWALWVVFYARRRLSRGLRDTYQTRMTSFMRGTAYVVGHGVFFMVVAIVYWASLPTDTAPSVSPAAWLFCLFFSARGVATAGVWLHNHNLGDLVRAERAAALRAKAWAATSGRGGAREAPSKVNKQLQPHLNLALRKEILHYTTLAIRMSVVQAVGEERVLRVMETMKAQLKAGVAGGPGATAPRSISLLGGGGGRGQGGARLPAPPHHQQQQRQPVRESSGSDYETVGGGTGDRYSGAAHPPLRSSHSAGPLGPTAAGMVTQTRFFGARRGPGPGGQGAAQGAWGAGPNGAPASSPNSPTRWPGGGTGWRSREAAAAPPVDPVGWPSPPRHSGGSRGGRQQQATPYGEQQQQQPHVSALDSTDDEEGAIGALFQRGSGGGGGGGAGTGAPAPGEARLAPQPPSHPRSSSAGAAAQQQQQQFSNLYFNRGARTRHIATGGAGHGGGAAAAPSGAVELFSPMFDDEPGAGGPEAAAAPGPALPLPSRPSRLSVIFSGGAGPGGGHHGGDPEVDVAALASAHAPLNDREPSRPDGSLSVEWKPLEIALYAPLFERGGLYDLGAFTQPRGGAGAAGAGGGGDSAPEGNTPSRGSRTNSVVAGPGGGDPGSGGIAGAAARASAASPFSGSPPPGSKGKAAAPGGGGSPGPPASPGGHSSHHHHATPTSSHEGVIKRPPLELHDLAPDVFARIRDLAGITPAQFLFSLSRTTKERFSEGASGAFMCFSHDMRFVMKSMEKDEADTLQGLLRRYLSHLRSDPDTLVCRFYACMSLRLYRTTLYFVVMENVFPTRATIHERFDLKGSWAGRSASKGTPGTAAYCRYCNEAFTVGEGGRTATACPSRPNRSHVANEVLKDNDLTYKLRLAPEKAARLASQLRRDAAFLAACGVMDYSLLIGVHNRKFRVDDSGGGGGAGGAGWGGGEGERERGGGTVPSSPTAKWPAPVAQHPQGGPAHGGRPSRQTTGGGGPLTPHSPATAPPIGPSNGQPRSPVTAPHLRHPARQPSGSFATDGGSGFGGGLFDGGPVGGVAPARSAVSSMGAGPAAPTTSGSGRLRAPPPQRAVSFAHRGTGTGGEGETPGHPSYAEAQGGGGLGDGAGQTWGSQQPNGGDPGAADAAPAPASSAPGSPSTTAADRRTGPRGSDADDEAESAWAAGAGVGGLYRVPNPLAAAVASRQQQQQQLAPQVPMHPAPGSPPTAPAAHTPFFRAEEGGLAASVIEGPGVFYMGIIDILQGYNLIKRVERWIKTALLLQDGRGISVMAPDKYADRFDRRVIAELIEHRDTVAALLSLPPRVASFPGGGGGQGAGAAAALRVHHRTPGPGNPRIYNPAASAALLQQQRGRGVGEGRSSSAGVGAGGGGAWQGARAGATAPARAPGDAQQRR